jgi:hypothetical protein
MMFFEVREPRRTRIVRVTPRLLTRVLQLPKDVEVMEVGQDAHDQLYFIVSSATFADGGIPLEHDLREPKPRRRRRRPTATRIAEGVPA